MIEENSNILETTTSSSTFCSSSDNDDELNTRIKDMLATNCLNYDEKNQIKSTMMSNDDTGSPNILLKKSQSCTTDFFSNKGRDSGLYLYVDFHGHASKKGF